MPTANRTQIARKIEQRLERDAGVNATAEIQGSRVMLSGRVDTPEAKQAASDIVAAVAPELEVDNDLEIEQVTPTEMSEFSAGDQASVALPENVDEIHAAGSHIEPDFMETQNDTTSLAAAGVDAYEESDTAYDPPTDPVITTDQNDNVQVLNGFSESSMAQIEVERSSDGTLGDEAIAEAILRELREDAATTALTIRVEVRQGVAHLRGAVPDVVDAENAEEVASRVPGVVEVREELEVQAV